MSRNAVLIILVLLLLFGGGPYFYAGERGPYYSGVGLGGIVLIVVLLYVLGVRL